MRGTSAVWRVETGTLAWSGDARDADDAARKAFSDGAQERKALGEFFEIRAPGERRSMWASTPVTIQRLGLS